MTDAPGRKLLAVRIVVRAKDRAPHDGRWWRRMARQDLAHHLVRQAHAAGLPLSTVQRSPLGFVNHGPIVDDDAGESPNPHAVVSIEIVGDTASILAFLNRHRSVLGHAHVDLRDATGWSANAVHPVAHHPHRPRWDATLREEDTDGTDA